MVRITNVSQKSAGVLLTGPGGHKENNNKTDTKLSQISTRRYKVFEY